LSHIQCRNFDPNHSCGRKESCRNSDKIRFKIFAHLNILECKHVHLLDSIFEFFLQFHQNGKNSNRLFSGGLLPNSCWIYLGNLYKFGHLPLPILLCIECLSRINFLNFGLFYNHLKFLLWCIFFWLWLRNLLKFWVFQKSSFLSKHLGLDPVLLLKIKKEIKNEIKN
jgi:hypothetical protein